MGVESTRESQRNAYWKMLKLNQKIRRLLESLGSESFPPQLQAGAKQTKVKIDQHFGHYRKLVDDFRELSYDLRLQGDSNCEPFQKHSRYSDPVEVFPNWVAKYRGPNYSFGSLASDGEKISPEEGRDFSGFWQLFRNVTPIGDDRLDLWPSYFGQSSVGNWKLSRQRDILDELRFPLSGADLNGAIAVDLETSSLSPLTGEILEIGIVELNGPDPTQWHRFSLRFDLSSDRARALGTGSKHIHGIAVEDLNGAPSIRDEKVQELLKGYLCSGRRIITHNGPFEFRWLSQYVDGFFEANYDHLGLQSIIDTAILCKFAFSIASTLGAEGNSLEATVKELGFAYEDAHRAQADAAMAALAAQGMLELLGAKKIQRLDPKEYTLLLSLSLEPPTL